MKKKIIQLPRGYISYSQVALWQSDPRRYAEIYFDGRDELRHTNIEMDYGKLVADALEKGQETGDILTDAAMLLLPKYDVADQEIRTEMRTKDGWIQLLGKPDSLDSNSKAFLEFKTGKNPWTQNKAQNHLQMHFYAAVIYVAYKVVPPAANLVWIQTEKITREDGTQEIRPTGRVENFPVKITLKKIVETMSLITRAAKEIEIAYASHVSNPALTTF